MTNVIVIKTYDLAGNCDLCTVASGNIGYLKLQEIFDTYLYSEDYLVTTRKGEIEIINRKDNIKIIGVKINPRYIYKSIGYLK